MNETYFSTGTLPLEVVLIKIGFIGAGKVGFSLGKFLTNHNITVSGYFSRSLKSAEEAAVFTNTACYTEVEALITNSDLIFITVPDDEIYNVYLNIKNISLTGKFLCHCSGTLSSQIFSDIDDFGAFSYSIHPIFPISDKYESYKYLKDAIFTIEGNSQFLPSVISLLGSTGVKIIPMQQSNKVLYHLAAVNVSNLFLALLKRSCSYLKSYGFNEAEAVKALYPLICANINNALDQGITNALTGPAERGDINTIASHISAMPSEHVHVYKALTEELIMLAKEKNMNKDYSSLENYLK